MVSEKKVSEVKLVKEQLRDYPVIGILDMFKLPARQLHKIRNNLRGEAVIRMVKKRLIPRVLKDSRPDLERLADYIQGEPALILSRTDPFRLARIIAESKSPSAAKPGDIATRDIEVKAGPTPLPPGPVIGELQKIKIPCAVQGDKISVSRDTVIAREGDVITRDVAGVLSKLRIEPMEVGLNLLAAWEQGVIYGKDILFIPREEYLERLKSAAAGAFNLSVNINYITGDNIGFLLSRAHSEARALAREARVITPETIGPLMAKARAEAEALGKRIEG
jgi:large subunit ribosomal protein L10